MRLAIPSDMIGEPIPTLEEMRYHPIMPTNRTLPLLVVAAALPLWAWAQSPGQAPAPGNPAPSPLVPGGKKAEPPSTPAEQVIDEAAKKLRATESLAADVTMDADILNQKFRVVGQYLKGPSFRILLRLDVEGLGDVTGTIQQVSDGATLWEVNQILESRSLRKIALQPLLAVLQKPEVDAEVRDQLLMQIGFAGPHALLEGLRKTMAFDQIEEGTLEGQTVWIIRGAWKDRAALGLPGAPNVPADAPAQSIVGAAAFLPPYVPGSVELWLGKEDGWPHKLILKGHIPSILRDDRILGPDGRPVGRKAMNRKERPTEILLLYKKKDKTVEDTDFLFTPPPGVDVQDDTDRAVTALEAQLAQIAASKRNAAAGGEGEGELLDQPITAPRPEGETVPSSPAPPPPPPAVSPETFRSSASPK